jgi:predicted permease
METEDLVSQGVPPQQARRRALLALGGIERFKTEGREVSRGRWLMALPTELLWAWRGVRGRGLGSVFPIGLVALTIAASAVVFSATDAYVFRPAPYPNADRLVVFQHTNPAFRGASDAFAPQDIGAWRQHSDLFSSVESYGPAPMTYLTIGGVTESVRTEVITPGLFDALGVLPRWGRPFVPADAAPAAPTVVVIAAELARHLFGDPADAVDRYLQSANESWRVVGVMPNGFRFPSALEQVWRPLRMDDSTPLNGMRLYRALGVMAPGASLDQVTRSVVTRRASIVGVLPLNDTAVTSLVEARRDPHALLFVMLLGAAVCLLLVSCLNVAGLELAAAMGRTRAYAVQTAFGATRSSLVRTALMEGALLTGLGALAAFALASSGTTALARLLPAALVDTASKPIDVDLRVVGFITGATILTWILTTTPVAWRASRPNVADGLRHDARLTTISRAHAAARHLLMAAQVALTVLLVIAAVLFVRSYAAHLTQSKGFDSTRLATIQVSPPPNPSSASGTRSAVTVPPDDSHRAELEGAILSRLRSLPSVVSVSRSDMLLPSTQYTLGSLLEIAGRTTSQGWVKFAGYTVDPGYFATVGIPLRAGRWFGPADQPEALVVDQAFAQRFWPKGDAVGARLHLYVGWGGANPGQFEIVGIAGHVRGTTVESGTADDVFVLYSQIPPGYWPLTFVIRLQRQANLNTLIGVVRSMAPGCVVRSTLVDDRYAQLYGDTRVALDITSGFGLVALLVAMAGAYGLLTYLVSGRTREIGIRIALGASPTDIRRLALGSTMTFVFMGAVVGLAAAAAVSHWLQTQLFGVSATDPVTYGVVTAIIVVVAFLATWRPAQRAAHLDPVITLRAE